MKWSVGFIVFLIVFGFGCYLWYQWDIAPYREAAERTRQYAESVEHQGVEALRQREGDNLVDAPGDITETTAAKPIPEATVAVKNTTDAPRQQHAQTPQENMIAIAVPVSPFGLGPYPEIPAHWPADIQHFPAPNKEVELITRVCIALNSEGYNAIGGTIENGRVFANIENVVYISWTEDERAGRYISAVSGWPPSVEEVWEHIHAVEDAEERNFTLSDMPAHIKAVDHSEAGVDPYTYLGLNP